MLTRLDRIIQGDCIEELGRLEEGSVDLVFADPPFNIGYTYDEYDDRRADEDYLGWSERWMAAVQRALRPWGAFWLAIGDEYAAELKVAATRNLGLLCRGWVVWYYTFGVHCNSKFTRSHAHLFYFLKPEGSSSALQAARRKRSRKAKSGHNLKLLPTPSPGLRGVTFNDAAIRVPSARQLVYADRRANPKGRVPDDTWIIPPAGAAPSEEAGNRRAQQQSVGSSSFVLRPQDLPGGFAAESDTWYFPRVCGTFKERMGFHGCQMPEQLLGRIIRACSNEGDVVLDPFAGSGTTLAVARKLGRRYVGTELSKEYAEQCQRRLAAVHPGDPLDGTEDPLTSVPDTSNGKVRMEDGRRVRREAVRRARKTSAGGQQSLWS